MTLFLCVHIFLQNELNICMIYLIGIYSCSYSAIKFNSIQLNSKEFSVFIIFNSNFNIFSN